MIVDRQICGFDIEEYCREYTFGGKRKGFYVHLEDSTGQRSTGEIAPLPTRSIETYEQAHQNLLKLRERFLGINTEPFALYPSVMFGIQMALYSLQHPNQKPTNDIVKLHITPPTKPTPSEPIKLKLGHLTEKEAVDTYNMFTRKEQNIRIDLERLWSLPRILSFCKQVDTSSILFIEDPVPVFSELETFYKETGVMYAVDQFLPFAPAEKIKSLEGLHSIVVKPSLVGGLHECRKIAESFAPVPIYFSSLFETEVGINHVRLISDILFPGQDVGCDTLKFLRP